MMLNRQIRTDLAPWLSILCAGALLAALYPQVGRAQPPAGQAVTPPSNNTALIYDSEYPYINYSGTPRNNEIARLQVRLDRGEVKLERQPVRGYLDSILKALKIDVSSQVLVFSKTSLQVSAISSATPRAIYFNDDTYVAWVQGTDLLEIVTMDADRGPVFYTINSTDPQPRPEREMLRCLVCHDSFGEMRGGVPQFMILSSFGTTDRKVAVDTIASMITSATPIEARWGGWYVTGDDGGVLHLGNITVPAQQQAVKLTHVYRGSVPSLTKLFDTSPYLTDKSDIVALLVLEHQVDIHNLIIRANYKSRMLLERQATGDSNSEMHWSQLEPSTRKALQGLLEPFVKGMLSVDAAPLAKAVAGSSGFGAWFAAKGPRDPQGRSLRDLDLQNRVFRYPLSFLVYSEGFDALPVCVREYVYGRLAEILKASNPVPGYEKLSALDRHAVLEILRATKPDFARALNQIAGNPQS
ncbi:MAG TPA: hypothetical protein VGV09_14340 [Steroidobacteraceae bacterium]|nr:hypothetical protein [Steroidobacteraceae bacterium]